LTLLACLVARDVRIAYGRGSAAMPVIFFLLVATLYPFAVGPDNQMISSTGGGVLWIAALLAALLPVDRLILPDMEAGLLDQYAVRGAPDEMLVAAKMVAHWLSFAPPLLLAVIPAALLLRLDGDMLVRIEISLLIGTAGLAALAVGTACLTASLRGAAALAGLLMLPLAIPLLIFGAGSLGSGSAGALKLLAATTLLCVAGTPFAAGAALRALRD